MFGMAPATATTMTKMMPEAAAVAATRKGPWTEHEDLQLVWFVRLFGERRWDFLAEVSGLNRTGKSCRLRWVNYLHPGLKRGRMTPQEERLVLELHDKWGNRWSRIARKLPGRTDNEIKNYWRTLMRKKAQGRSGSVVSSPPSSPSSASSNVSSSIDGSQLDLTATKYATGSNIPTGNSLDLSEVKGYTMDQIWNEIAASESVGDLSFEDYKDGSACIMGGPMASPLWEDCESLWRTHTEDVRMMTSMSDLVDSNCKQSIDSLEP
ncbi:hypothetical protein ZIOFF_063179 [Zingiber officinale]|uniref:Uncharacterized protein n=2 Tax=Zingiber officinale TaxID=94328 RepID=A0A8J5F5Y8_ZINOF|nr:hypothetical protein ZIOFF_063179 [Zingiber officinale]